MKAFKRALAILLAVALTGAFLSGCGGGEQKAAGNEPVATDTPAALEGKVYVPSFTALPAEAGSFSTCCFAGDSFYTAGWVYDKAADESSYSVGVLSADGSVFEPLSWYVPMVLPEGVEGKSYIDGIVADDEGNIWIAESAWTYHFEIPEGIDVTEEYKWQYQVEDGTVHRLRKMSPDGQELASVDLTEIAEASEYFNVGILLCDKDGNLYLSDGETSVYAYDSDGAKLFTVSVENYVDSLIRLSDGRVAASGYSEGGFSITAIDTEKKAWGERFSVAYPDGVYSGSGEYLFLYTLSNCLWGWDAATGEGVKILNWIDCDVDSSYINFVSIDSDGVVKTLCNSIDGEESTELVVITPTDASQVVEKTTLTLATMNLSWELRGLVLSFNKTSDQFRIQVKDYSEFNTDEDYDAGLTKLNTEIIAGNVPDIIDVTQLPVTQYAAIGLLEDLYPYIDADAELSRDLLMEAILRAQEIGGSLYQASSSFGVFTVLGRTELIGEKMGWTLDEMLAILADAPEGAELFSPGITKNNMLNYMCYTNMDHFVDWQTGSCGFESQDFIDILRFCDLFPETYEWNEDSYESEPSLVMSGKQLLSMLGAYDFNELQVYEAMYGGSVTFKGFPRAEGSGNTAMIDSGLAVSTACENKDAAWQFVRLLFTEEYQNDNVYSFPTNKASFEKKLSEAMTPNYYTDPETYEQVESSKGGMSWDDFTVELYAMTQEQADQIMGLIESIDSTMTYDESVANIVTEEAAAYFAGQKTVEETARLIQSRVSIYVNEQR